MVLRKSAQRARQVRCISQWGAREAGLLVEDLLSKCRLCAAALAVVGRGRSGVDVAPAKRDTENGRWRARQQRPPPPRSSHHERYPAVRIELELGDTTSMIQCARNFDRQASSVSEPFQAEDSKLSRAF